MSIPRSSVSAVLLVGAVVVGTTASAQSREEQSLPPGPGQGLLLEACVQCHDLRAVTSQEKDVAAWRRTVNEMIWRGAPVLPGEVDVMTKYLAAGFGPHHPKGPAGALSGGSTDTAARLLPEDPARTLVLRSCVSCHDLRTTVTARKTDAEWRLSVERMARLGARLNGREAEDVALYLFRSFGPAKTGPDAMGRRAPHPERDPR